MTYFKPESRPSLNNITSQFYGERKGDADNKLTDTRIILRDLMESIWRHDLVVCCTSFHFFSPILVKFDFKGKSTLQQVKLAYAYFLINLVYYFTPCLLILFS